MDYTLQLISWLGPLMTLAQLGGVGLVLWGGYQLLTSLHSDGPSASALGALRGELTRLARPLLAALGGLLLLLTLALMSRSPLTHWTMVIAPLSTFVWLVRVNHGARRLTPGELLEALAPLSPPSDPLSPELAVRAHAVAAEGLPLTGQALAQTALRALDEARERPEGARLKDLPISDLIALLRDTLKDLHAAALRLPLARGLTLAGWEAEVRRVEREWEQSLSRVDLGRALVNPLTLVDKVPHLHPKTLLERELAAWLHAGLYALITRRLLALGRTPAPTAPAPNAHAPDADHDARAPEPARPPQALLLGLFKTKLSAPTWLYMTLLSAAAVESYGALGALAALAAGGATWWALRETFSLSRLRAACERLSAFQAPAPAADDPRAAEAAALVRARLARSKEELSARPCGALLSVVTEGALSGAEVYRRRPEDAAPLRYLNATLPDALATAYWVCDDVLVWREKSGALQTLVGLLSAFGVGDMNLDELIRRELHRWAGSAPATQDPSAPSDEPSQPLSARAARLDDWYQGKLKDLSVWVRMPIEMGVNALTSSILEWLGEEVERRLNELYLARVAPPA